MIIRLVIAIIIVVIALKLYKRLCQEKACETCSQRIAKQAQVCHHCHTIQNSQSS